MPFIRGDDEGQGHLNKRRKLNSQFPTLSNMTKQIPDVTDTDPWQMDDNSTEKPDDAPSSHKVEFPAHIVKTSSREELMECIKRGQRPTWVPNPNLQALCDEDEALRTRRKSKDVGNDSTPQLLAESSTQPIRLDHVSQPPPPPPPPPPQEPYERPRSALHRGDFSEEDSPPRDQFVTPLFEPGLAITTTEASIASPQLWHTTSPTSLSTGAAIRSLALSQLNTGFPSRRRAPSLGSSLSSSFVMRAPTSPLVHATSNLDLHAPSSHPASQRDNSRRRTLPPSSFQSLTMTSFDTTPPNFSRPFAPALRRESSMPTQSHQPSRSLSSFTYHPRSNPQTPFARSRRPSVTSESGSRRRTSMVGSFEESIIRGRMSTPASRPFDFVAQIGVMGKGDCPSSLKCPAHVTIPFPAVYYNYPASSGSRSVADDTPSPYVGTINLTQNLKDITLSSGKRGKKSDNEDCSKADSRQPVAEVPKIRIGGAYRVPQQGQLQIIIKNPNKTAVKLFLIPYDLSGMEPMTKTFVRQRSFSTGSIVDNIAGSSSANPTFFDPLQNKHILRYLVHLKFCSPARGRYYLHDDIRVVFANRVPDGKERLRNEVQLPEPKFTPWKSLRSDQSLRTPKSVPTTPTTLNFDFDSPRMFGEMEGFSEAESPMSFKSTVPDEDHDLSQFDMSSVTPHARSFVVEGYKALAEQSSKTPFVFEDIKQSRDPFADPKSPERTVSPVTGFSATTPRRASPLPWSAQSNGHSANGRSSPIPSETRDSLLSIQLRHLTTQTQLLPLMRKRDADDTSRTG